MLTMHNMRFLLGGATTVRHPHESADGHCDIGASPLIQRNCPSHNRELSEIRPFSQLACREFPALRVSCVEPCLTANGLSDNIRRLSGPSNCTSRLLETACVAIDDDFASSGDSARTITTNFPGTSRYRHSVTILVAPKLDMKSWPSLNEEFQNPVVGSAVVITP
jgi:hypothetical protein